MAATSTLASVSLREYIKKYKSSGGAEQPNKEKKAKKKKKPKPATARGVLIMDEDPSWQKLVKFDEEDEEPVGEEEPVVDEDVEVKHLKRLELLRSRKPRMGANGSSSPTPKVSSSASSVCDLSPTRQHRARFDTPLLEHEQAKTSKAGYDLSPPFQWQRHYHSSEPPSESIGFLG